MSEAEVSASDVYLQNNVVFEKGKKHLIKANSGHGKTSVLNFIYGSNFNYSGSIAYNLSNNGGSTFNLRKNSISYVFQDFKLFPDLTIIENIQLKNSITNHKSLDEIHKLISQVQLHEKKDTKVATLSLGQKQRVAIVRALCQPFDFLLMDEPFSHLDKKNIEVLTTIINHELEQRNAGLILTSLDSEYLFNYDKVLNL